MITNDYKKQLIKHDYEVAGFLYENKINMLNLPSAFTHDNTEYYEQGEIILRNAGYDESTENSLISSIEAFHNKYSVIALFLSLGMGMVLLTVLVIFAMTCSRVMEKANSDILNFMNSEYEIRLDDSREGNFSKLFSAVNMMATSLTTHIIKEKQNKEFFLKIF